MKRYVQFLETKLDGSIDEALGSDGVFILDGRQNLDTQINDAYERLDKLKNVRPYYVGFEIRDGERFSNSRLVYRKVIPERVEAEKVKVKRHKSTYTPKAGRLRLPPHDEHTLNGIRRRGQEY